MKGEASWHRAPIDVVTKTEGIEVKAFHTEAKEFKCRMAKDAIARKEAFCAKEGLKGRTVMVIVNDKFELYSRAGFGNFRKENMEFIGAYPNPKKVR